MTSQCFTTEITDGIAVITMNRPDKRNSMIPDFWRELPDLVEEIDAESKARVIVIASTGPHFTSGLDLSVLSSINAGSGDPRTDRISAGARFMETVKPMQRTFSALEDCRIPVLAAIQGGCIGGGVDLATACDMRYATEDAFFCVEEISIGMTADVGTFPRLRYLIPEGVVREMCYTGRRVGAEEAVSLGLVNQVFDDQALMLEGVMAIARDIASKAPLAVYGCKRMLNYSRDHSTRDTLDYVGVWNASMLQPEEIMEAVAARKEKRPGRFVDLPKRSKRTGTD